MDGTSLLFGRDTLHVPGGLIYVFLAFQLVDQIILPILVITFIFTSVNRHPTLVNVCLTWIFSAVFSSLLFYTGTHVGPEPPQVLCATQAALLDAVLPMNTVAILALMFQTHRSVCRKKAENKMINYLLLIAPYFVFFCFAIAAALLVVHSPNDVNRARRFFYCSIHNDIFSGFFVMFAATVLLVAMGFQVAIGIFLHRNWGTLRQSCSLDFQTVTRITLFGSYCFLGLVFSILAVTRVATPAPDLFIGSVGTVLAISLSSQSDIYRAWFRRPLPAPPSVEHSPDTVAARETKV